MGAEREFRHVAERDDYPEAWLNLASELAALDRPDDALDAVRRALRLGIQRAAVAMPAGELALRLGDEALAVEAWSAAIARVPTLAGDPWWASSQEREAAFQAALDGAVGRVGDAYAWELAVMAGDPEQARALAAQAPDTELADLVIRSWDGEHAARDDLEIGCAARPLDLAWLHWCGRIAQRDGDDEAAARFQHAAGFILGGANETASLLRVATTSGTGRWAAGEPAEFWGWYTYRRPTPWDVLVPDLVHLVVG